MDVPRVTVVIAAYQAGRFIETAIASVTAQTMGSWECIVVDDGSTDDTSSRVRALAQQDARIRCEVQGHLGAAAARNAGLRATRAEFVQFLDADDWIAPAKLARHLALFDADPTLGLVYGEACYFDDARPGDLRRTLGPADRAALPSVSGQGEVLVEALVRRNIMVVEAPLVRRRLLESVGAFDERLPYLEDWDLWLRCALAGAAFRFDPGDMGRSYVRVRPSSVSADRRAMLRAEIELRRRLDSRLSDVVSRRANALAMTSADIGVLILEAPRGRLRDEMGRMARAAARWRQPRWALWVLALPLLRLRVGRLLIDAIRRTRRSWGSA